MKYHVHTEGKNGWCDWLNPKMKGYKMACCDCGLVHEINFRVFKIIKKFKDGSYQMQLLPTSAYGVRFKAKRNTRSTSQKRRNLKHKILVNKPE